MTIPETYTRIDVDGNEDENGDYVLFGSYPQSEVKNHVLETMLNTKAGDLPTAENPQAWTSYDYYINGTVQDYMWYQDVTLNGETYRGVYFESYRPSWTIYYSSTGNSDQDENGYFVGNVYWFQYEPLKWRILSEEDGTALILCESIIDGQQYYNNTSDRTIDEQIYPNNYEYSDIRAWLNEVFYETAFTELQKALIETTLVDNSARSTNPQNEVWNNGVNVYACNDTEDKVFLLSEREVTNSEYGFNGDSNRIKVPTAYAKVQGTYINNGDGVWWIRSPYCNYSLYGRGVSYGGIAAHYGNVFHADYGVVPALQIRF
ncbi:MAG: hypothetical protein E7680_01290 [Ruminococcaceae bacterium]|nr:hypothetical protein [Oscillospiraceae bacterium]